MVLTQGCAKGEESYNTHLNPSRTPPPLSYGRLMGEGEYRTRGNCNDNGRRGGERVGEERGGGNLITNAS